ncbi:response regulator transcription factor [Novosphingobium sp. TH158]|uniref:response regulator transcription factor n=1 Tax=Novosphingobium sp. TH158 TaxID=2067455 RepID=UPI0020B17221|nr:response regulator transcription factor [Novosphingobium sp. TH158]
MFPDRICIIDDDTDFAQFLAQYLELRKAQAKVFGSAEEFMQSNWIDEFDFFIVDLGLPGLDGVDLTALIRARSDAGILVISGRMGPDAFNSALAAGADMFVNKPVRFDQVSHAISSVWRRAPKTKARDNGWSIDKHGMALVTPDGTEVSLSVLESRLILRLMDADGQPVTRTDLVEAAEMHGGSDHRNLDAAIFRLRRKIEKESGMPAPFKTVHGVGYQFVGVRNDGGGAPAE